MTSASLVPQVIKEMQGCRETKVTSASLVPQVIKEMQGCRETKVTSASRLILARHPIIPHLRMTPIFQLNILQDTDIFIRQPHDCIYLMAASGHRRKDYYLVKAIKVILVLQVLKEIKRDIGVQGGKGDDGVTGAIGPKGDKGDAGVQGRQRR